MPWLTVRKYFNIVRVSLIERMAYRGDFLLGTILRFLPMITTILLWEAIYAGSGQEDISGFRFKEMIAYLLLVHISRMFSSMPGLAGGITRDIRDGTLKKYLLQPIDMLGYLVSYRLAHKTAYICTSCWPYAALFLIFSSYFEHWPSWPNFAGYVAALLLGFLIGFFFEASLGLVGFWILEVSSLLYIVNTLTFFLSGHLFPLDLLPEGFAAFFKWMPFQYLAYFPAAVFLGKIEGEELLYGLLREVGWCVVLIVISRWLYHRGLRRYSAYGG
jgi:ABC-2 type transport system permease protein